jgi:hypothetical protein
LTVATENAPALASVAGALEVTVDSVTMPSLLAVAASATMSGTGLCETTSVGWLTPGISWAGGVLRHVKLRMTSVGPNAGPVSNAIRNVWKLPAGMVTGVFAEPTRALVNGSVVWNRKFVGVGVTGSMRQPTATPAPLTAIAAKYVAVVPDWTERAIGITAAVRNSWFPIRVRKASVTPSSLGRRRPSGLTCGKSSEPVTPAT